MRQVARYDRIGALKRPEKRRYWGMVAFAMSHVERATVQQESFCASWFLLCVMT